MWTEYTLTIEWIACSKLWATCLFWDALGHLVVVTLLPHLHAVPFARFVCVETGTFLQMVRLPRRNKQGGHAGFLLKGKPIQRKGARVPDLKDAAIDCSTSMESIHKYQLAHRDKQTELHGCPGPSKQRAHRPWRNTERGRVLSPTMRCYRPISNMKSASFIFTPPSFWSTSFTSGSPLPSNLPVLLTLHSPCT